MANRNIARFRFYEELNDFLPKHRKKVIFEYDFIGHPSIKNAIEGIGIPHTEVDLILINGESVGFEYQLAHGDFVSVYPVFETFDISSLVKLHQRPLRKSAFILDVHLGKLARRLRLLGFDTLYRSDYDDPEIVRIAAEERRIILTRDKGLLCSNAVTHGYLIRSQNINEQVQEVLRRFYLFEQVKAFTRCLACNGIIIHVEKKDIVQLLQPKTIRYYDSFYQCVKCRKVYWKGSHYKKLVTFIEGYQKNRIGG